MGKGLEKSYAQSVDRRRGLHDTFASQAPGAGALTPDYIAQEARLGQVLDEHMYGPSAAAGAAQDPYAAAMQGQIADSYQDIYASGGLTEADRANMRLGMNDVNQGLRARQEALMQNLQARGMGGSGAEIAARLSNEQTGAMQAADFNAQMQIAAQARQERALEGMGGASQNRYNMLYQSGTAEDVINQANTDRRRQVYDDNLAHQRDMDAGRADTHNRQQDAGVQGRKDAFNAASIVHNSANRVEDEEIGRIAYKTSGIDKKRQNEMQAAQQLNQGLSTIGNSSGGGR